MKTPNTIEDEIDAIRRQIYEETKHMTPEQRVEHRRRITEPIIKQFGMKTAASAWETPIPSMPRFASATMCK